MEIRKMETIIDTEGWYDRAQIVALMRKAPSLRNYGGSPKMLVCGEFIYSYDTCVAMRQGAHLVVPEWHSTTTTRHINIMADNLALDVVKLYKR
jgi:hypothetical protein